MVLNYTASASEIEMFCVLTARTDAEMKRLAKHLIETYGGNFDPALTMYWELEEGKPPSQPKKSEEESVSVRPRSGEMHEQVPAQKESVSDLPGSGKVHEQVPVQENWLEKALRLCMKSDGSVPYDGSLVRNVIDVRFDAWMGQIPNFQCSIRNRNLKMEVDLYGNFVKILNTGETVINLNNWMIQQTSIESSQVDFQIREDKLKLVGTSVCLSPDQSLTIWSSINAVTNSPSAYKMPYSRWGAGDRTTILYDASHSEVYSLSHQLVASSQEQRSEGNCNILPNYVEAVIPASSVDQIKKSINHLQEMSGTRMEKVEWSNDGSARIRIFGDQQKIDKGLLVIHDLLDQKEMTVMARQVRVEIIIPGPKAEFITDAGGEIIKKLQESSGTQMVVVEDGPLEEKVKKLRIYGDQLKVEIAQQLVHDLMAEESEINVPPSSSRKRTHSPDPIGKAEATPEKRDKV